VENIVPLTNINIGGRILLINMKEEGRILLIYMEEGRTLLKYMEESRMLLL